MLQSWGTFYGCYPVVSILQGDRYHLPAQGRLWPKKAGRTDSEKGREDSVREERKPREGEREKKREEERLQ